MIENKKVNRGHFSISDTPQLIWQRHTFSSTIFIVIIPYLALLHSERSKLHILLAVLSAIGLRLFTEFDHHPNLGV